MLMKASLPADLWKSSKGIVEIAQWTKTKVLIDLLYGLISSDKNYAGMTVGLQRGSSL